MAWRMTILIPPELEDALRNEEHETRKPISKIVRELLEKRYATQPRSASEKSPSLTDSIHSGVANG